MLSIADGCFCCTSRRLLLLACCCSEAWRPTKPKCERAGYWIVCNVMLLVVMVWNGIEQRDRRERTGQGRLFCKLFLYELVLFHGYQSRLEVAWGSSIIIDRVVEVDVLLLLVVELIVKWFYVESFFFLFVCLSVCLSIHLISGFPFNFSAGHSLVFHHVVPGVKHNERPKRSLLSFSEICLSPTQVFLSLSSALWCELDESLQQIRKKQNLPFPSLNLEKKNERSWFGLLLRVLASQEIQRLPKNTHTCTR